MNKQTAGIEPTPPSLSAVGLGFPAPCGTASADVDYLMEEVSVGQLKDLIQLAANNGAYLCPLAGQDNKPKDHDWHCAACRVRKILTPGWWVAPEIEMKRRLLRAAEEVR